MLHYLEGLVGEAAFAAFVNHYIVRYKYLTVTSGEFKDCFEDFFFKIVSVPSSNHGKYRGSSARKAKKQSAGKSPVKPGSSGGPEAPDWRDSEAQEARLMALAALDWPQLLLGRGLPAHVTAATFANPLSLAALQLSGVWLAYARSFSEALLQGRLVPSNTLAAIYSHKAQDLQVTTTAWPTGQAYRQGGMF